MSYQKYGITDELVQRVKLKLKNPIVKEKVKAIIKGVTKHDLQDRTKVKKLVDAVSKVLGEKLTEQQRENIINFVIAQKIDPNNTYHLIKLWGMFR